MVLVDCCFERKSFSLSSKRLRRWRDSAIIALPPALVVDIFTSSLSKNVLLPANLGLLLLGGQFVNSSITALSVRRFSFVSNLTGLVDLKSSELSLSSMISPHSTCSGSQSAGCPRAQEEPLSH